MTTRDRIRNMISQKPMTRNEIANRLGVSRKTVSNRLAEIHNDVYRSYKHEGSNKVYSILEDTRRGNRYFSIDAASRGKLPYPISRTLGKRTFELDRLMFTSDSNTMAGVYKH